MKKLVFSLLICFGALAANAQQDSTLAPYKRFPTVPPFDVLLSDSTTRYKKDDIEKKTPLLLIIFSPDCEHCQHETEALIKHIDELKKVQILMVTMLPFEKLKDFYVKYDLQRFSNIKVGKDMKYMLPTFFQVHNLPYLAFYDKKGKLITTFEGGMKIEDVIKTFD